MKEKSILGAIAAVGGYIMNCFNEIMVVLAIFMMIDYIIGTMVSLFLKNDHFDKKKGIRGLLKKIGYMVCVVIGILLDYVILWLSKTADFKFSTNGFFGIAVTCYLIGTEGLSIAGHLYVLGVPVPKFLERAFEKLKESSESISKGV